MRKKPPTKIMIGIWPLFVSRNPTHLYKSFLPKLFIYFSGAGCPRFWVPAPHLILSKTFLSTAGLGGRPRACKKHRDPLGIGSPVTGSSVHGGNDPPWLAPAVHGVEYPILDKRLWYQVPPFGGIWRQRPEDRLLYTQARNGPGLPPIGGSRPSPFFASPTTDVRKGFRMNLYHALIADGGRYVGVASFHSPPTHCRKTKGGVGVRKRPPPVSLRNPLLTPRLLDRYAPLCLRGPRVVGVS